MSKASPTNTGLQTQTLARQPLTLTRYSAAPVLIRLASAPLWFCVAIGFCFGFVKRRANRILGWVIDASMYGCSWKRRGRVDNMVILYMQRLIVM